MRRAPLSGWFRRLVHVISLIAGWALFGWFWWHVIATQSFDHRLLVWLIGGSLVLLPLVTVIWVLHNVAIFRAKGPRRQVRERELQYPQDWMGRRVEADWPALRAAQAINIRLDNGTKQYRPS
jgi:hypothetical protein